MRDWIKRKLRRRKIHKEMICYKCESDGLLQWYVEKKGLLTYEEGYLCAECAPEEEEQVIVFQLHGVPPQESISVKQMQEDWIKFVKEIEAEEKQ